MQIPSFALYGLLEATVLLAITGTFLIVYIGHGKTKIRNLQNTIQTLLKRHKQLATQMAQARLDHSTSNTYQKQINDQLRLTREYHQGLGAGHDIALDLNPESPGNRQTAAIRHALLVAEKEALSASTDGTPNWQFLETKFQQLIRFYVDLNKSKPAPGGTGTPSPAGDNISNTNMRQNPNTKIGPDNQSVTYVNRKTVAIINCEKQALEELKKLRSLTTGQHALLDALQKQFDEAKTAEEKEAAITDLQNELIKQMQCVQESEACIQLLENELSNAMARLKTLEHNLKNAEQDLLLIPEMQNQLQSLQSQHTEVEEPYAESRVSG